MRFVVHHETQYRYSTPVVLAPHVLRLTPRAGEHQAVRRTLRLRPEPIERRDEIDPFGNQVTRVTFSDRPTEELHIDSHVELDTRTPPLAAGAPLAPLPWSGLPVEELARYRPGDAAVAAEVAGFARMVAAEAGHQPLAFLDRLCRTVYDRADRQIRPSGDAQSATETLATWRGACRDFTVLFLAAVRSVGMAARFCSGYQAAAQTPDGRRYLHAWPEVFLPGIGWRGWDPTHGISVGEGHVALCAAPDQAETMPVAGGYYFDGSITTTLDFAVTIRTT